MSNEIEETSNTIISKEEYDKLLVNKNETLTNKQIFYRLLKLIKGNSHYVVLGSLALALNSYTNVMFPKLIGSSFDSTVSSSSDSKEVIQNIIKKTSKFFLLGTLATFVRMYSFGKVHENLSYKLKEETFESFLSQDIEYYNENKLGEMISILETDIDTTCTLVSEKFPGLFRSLNSINGIIRLYSISPKLCHSALVVLPVAGVSTISISRLNNRQILKLKEKETTLLNNLIERINNISTIRLNNKENYELTYLKNYFKILKKFFLKKNLFTSFFNSFVNFSSNVTVLILLNYGGELIRQGELTSGELTSFLLQSGFVSLGLSSLSTFYSDYLKGISAARRIFNIIDQSQTNKNKKNEIKNDITFERLNDYKKKFTGDINIKNLTFSYNTRSDIKIFHDLNLFIPKNTITCFIGESGAGKSTLASLLCGLYQPTEGEIEYLTYKDQDLLINSKKLNNELQNKKISSLFGVMEQNSNNLMSGTIKENILYSIREEELNDKKEEEKQAELERLYSISSSFNFIHNLPLKEETEIGKNGSKLSGGQRARLCLARAIIKSPRYLLLDEPTSNLDRENEQEVIRLLKIFSEDTTLILFTHSEELLTIADQVYRVENHKITKVK